MSKRRGTAVTIQFSHRDTDRVAKHDLVDSLSHPFSDNGWLCKSDSADVILLIKLRFLQMAYFGRLKY